MHFSQTYFSSRTPEAFFSNILRLINIIIFPVGTGRTMYAQGTYSLGSVRILYVYCTYIVGTLFVQCPLGLISIGCHDISGSKSSTDKENLLDKSTHKHTNTHTYIHCKVSACLHHYKYIA